MISKIPINLLLVLLGIVILRIPSFFEPHWYGDEEIYLVLGQMMRRGAVLYRDIWDNKTPLLYLIYSISPTLFWAKLTATLAVLGTTIGTYFFSKKIFADRLAIYSLLPSVLVGIFLSLPNLEGNIANAELYFTLPIIWAAYLIYCEKKWFWTGLLTATAFLLKVPAVLDFVGLFLGFLSASLVDEYFSLTRNFRKLFVRQFRLVFKTGVTFFGPVVLVVLYFFFNHALADFLTAAFSQNASYVAVDSGPFSKLSNPLFVRGLLLLLPLLLLLVSYWKRLVSRELIFLTFWFGFSLYGALLSNRPYMHYLLQIVPPATILFFYFLAHLRRNFFFLIFLASVFYFLVSSFRGAFALDSKLYYQNFLDYISERKSEEDFASFFDNRTLDNYRVAEFVSANTKYDEPIFVWGDIAAIYDIADRPAATKFIQAHHLSTISLKNYDLIMQRLQKFQPKFVVVVRPMQFPFPALETLLRANYSQVIGFGQMDVFQNKLPVSPQKWSPNY